ncbi:MAG: acetyl-CoA carboxylase biotin carboxylase subunit, partial [Candidatus Hydrogenedentes bacterium]|nr:acetyl-CoA carboxylase biotin carboxylase subunit [Candidatus Hydrogenedentota bacterium]
MSRRFSTVLIANRGEIACRVIRTARAEGYRTVAVYSDADLGALHVEMADEAVRLGPAPVAESYLDAERVIAAAHAANADAIHPGYGFLSENASFAEACAEADITFIGPPPKAISEMGDKAEAKRIMLEAGVPCVPGYGGEVQDDATLKSEAAKIGFPVLLKATAGGGGRGMRRVDDEKGFDEALVGARSEAMKAFGSDSLIIEKMIEDARHVEIQVLADEHGTCIHLGERDCSVQRRHQKVVEESPCPVMTPELREAMGAAAVKAAQAAGYVNAGTVEFLLNDDGTFYFLEMNTRLQVEHPVTELVTGIDIVEQMIRIAAGETLDIEQDAVVTKGFAMEARIYAEDPSRGFLPAPGRIRRYRPPVNMAGVRIDSGVYEGAEVTLNYDPMIAKLCTWDETRAGAIARMSAALDEFELHGPGHNISFLASVMRRRRFREGRLDTGFIEAEYGDSFTGDAPEGETFAVLLTASVLIHLRECLRANRFVSRSSL